MSLLRAASVKVRFDLNLPDGLCHDHRVTHDLSIDTDDSGSDHRVICQLTSRTLIIMIKSLSDHRVRGKLRSLLKVQFDSSILGARQVIRVRVNRGPRKNIRGPTSHQSQSQSQSQIVSHHSARVCILHHLSHSSNISLTVCQ